MDVPPAFMREPYASMPPTELLAYFRSRVSVRYFSLSRGTPAHVERADKILENEFDFNNEVHRLPDPFDWKTNPSRDIEWLILLHKFYYARDLAIAYNYTGEERYASRWVQLVSSWISEVPNGFIDSQVTGRRLQQWLLAYHYFIPGRQCNCITPEFLTHFLRSVYSQTIYLCEHLTPEGNHRTIELYAIFLVAVVFPELKEALSLQTFAIQELLKNMECDLLEDGVQCELSTDYHHTVLKNYLQVKELAVHNKIALPPRFDELVNKALEFSIHVHKPDGLIPALNDGDSTSYLSLLRKAYSHYPSEYLLYVVSRGKKGMPPIERCKVFPRSGYYVLRGSWTHEPYEEGLYFVFDCGPLGFGTHGHYDLLNFEAAAYGHSLIVDPGRYTYNEIGMDRVNWRQIFKSTAYHNTVVVDGKDQSPYRPGAPIRPEPQPTVKTFATTDGFDFIHAQVVTHEYAVVHERMVMFVVPEYWIITDILRGEASHRYDLYFHLAPRAMGRTAFCNGTISTSISSPNLIIAQPNSPDIQATLVEGFVSSQYGAKQPAPILRFTQSTDKPTLFHTVVYPYRTEQPELTVERLVIRDQHGPCSSVRATAMSITIRTESNTYSDTLFIAHEWPLREYAFNDIVCRSQLLFLRKDGDGHIVNLQAEGLEQLQIGTKILADGIGNSRRVSHREQPLQQSQAATTLRGAIENCTALSQSGLLE